MAKATNTVQKPNYVMRKSAWSVVRPWHILLGFLIFPLIVMIVKIINIKDETISFYDNKVVERSGIFSKQEHTNILTHVLAVSYKQTFWGRICGYGDITIDVVGHWDIDMKGIKNPKKARDFLENYTAKGLGMQQFIMN